MLTRLLFGLAFLLTVTAARAADDEATWSKPVNGLRGRLVVYPSEDASSPFCRVYVELQNVERAMGDLKVAFSPTKVAFKVADQAAHAMAEPGIVDYDGFTPRWDQALVIPFDGTIRFRISFPGAGYNPASKAIIDLGPSSVWVIPQDGRDYFLSGVFKLAPKDRMEASTHSPWNGTLEFPPALIPKAK